MAVQKIKPPLTSPLFEKIQRDRLQRCAETAQSAKKAVERSKQLTEEARELIERIQRHRPDAGRQ